MCGRLLNSGMLRHTAHDECNVMLAAAYCGLGDLDRVVDHAMAALDRASRTGNARDEAEALVALGQIHLAAGRPGPALDAFTEGLRVSRVAVSRTAEIESLTGLASASGEHQYAVEAIGLASERGMRLLEAKALATLAGVRQRQGAIGKAFVAADQALSMFREFGHAPGERDIAALVSRLNTAGQYG